MPKKEPSVYQFKITLAFIKPPVWRRIQVPSDYTFWDLHVAIQDAMGWLDCHLHQFEIVDPKQGECKTIGIPDNEWDEDEIIAGWEKKLSAYFSLDNKKAKYVYDFGDNWEHNIVLEKIIPALDGIKYPICIKGARACPPEDCGGIPGYEELIEIMANPKHKEYKNMSSWLGCKAFDADEFEPSEIQFDDPQRRWDIAFQENRP